MQSLRQSLRHAVADSVADADNAFADEVVDAVADAVADMFLGSSTLGCHTAWFLFCVGMSVCVLKIKILPKTFCGQLVVGWTRQLYCLKAWFFSFTVSQSLLQPQFLLQSLHGCSHFNFEQHLIFLGGLHEWASCNCLTPQLDCHSAWFLSIAVGSRSIFPSGHGDFQQNTNSLACEVLHMSAPTRFGHGSGIDRTIVGKLANLYSGMAPRFGE